jgi:hypothetical protein
MGKHHTEDYKLSTVKFLIVKGHLYRNGLIYTRKLVLLLGKQGRTELLTKSRRNILNFCVMNSKRNLIFLCLI